MADNFLERKRRDYEERKQQWLKRKTRLSGTASILKKAQEKFNNE